MKYQISRDGQIIGAYSYFAVVEALEKGTFSESDYYWRDGLPQWNPLSDFKFYEQYVPTLKDKIRKIFWVSVTVFMPYFGIWKIYFDKSLAVSKSLKSILTTWTVFACLVIFLEFKESTHKDRNTNGRLSEKTENSSIIQKNSSFPGIGDYDDSPTNFIARGINLMMAAHTQTDVTISEDNKLLISSNQSLDREIKGVSLLKSWLFFSTLTAGAYFNMHPESRVDEIWLTERKTLTTYKKFFVLKVSRAKEIQSYMKNSSKEFPDAVDIVWNSLETRSLE